MYAAGLAFVAAAGVAGMADYDTVQPPAPVVQQSTSLRLAPLSAARLNDLQQAVAPHATDDDEVSNLRGDYGDTATYVVTQAHTFASQVAKLEQQGHQLDDFARRNAGTYHDRGMDVQVAPGDVKVTDQGTTTEAVRQGGVWTVTVTDASGAMQRLQESSNGRVLESGNVTMLQQAGFAGPHDFIIHETSPNRDRVVEVSDSRLHEKTTQQIAGYAGNLTVITEDTWMKPALGDFADDHVESRNDGTSLSRTEHLTTVLSDGTVQTQNLTRTPPVR